MMYSLSWPNMFNSATTNLSEDKQAIKTNVLLLLNTEKLTLFGDPYYGTFLLPALFQPNNNVIVDLLIDEIYDVLNTYMPQISVNRNDIRIYSNKIDLIAEIIIRYKISNTTDLYRIKLTNNQQEG